MPRAAHTPRILAVLTALALALSVVPGPAEAAPASAGPDRYVVALAQKPLVTYDGSIKGLPATQPTRGKRVNLTSAAAKRYRAYLKDKQDAAAARVGAEPEQRFDVGLNGFVADLTSAQAQALARSADVLTVAKDVRRELHDDRNSADFLRLTGPDGLWSRLGGADEAGAGVVVGIIDTGIWPENPSFAGEALGTTPPPSDDPYRPYRSGTDIKMTKSDGSTFVGQCQAGEDFTADLCSTKIVAARSFSAGFVRFNGPIGTADFDSPRDGNGHGSHVGATAAGNAEVPAEISGRSFGTVSGVAPAAKLAIYKAGFTADDGAEGFYVSDSLTAVNEAIGDGVDVLNYSVSSSDDVLDLVDLAFANAADAGIFVATSAGNSGPGASTLNHVVPWVTSVAASTVAPRAATVALGNGSRYVGQSSTVFGTVGSASLRNAAAIKLAAIEDAAAAVCGPITLDPAKTRGRIVVCDRGGVDRVVKSAEVARAGGIGMVLVNLTELELNIDRHSVPTIAVNPPATAAIKAYAARSGATARLVEGSTDDVPPYPQIAGFSSRGPSLGTEADILKPDLAAPGVNILAAVAPPSNGDEDFGFYSGTSMASPHVAGLAALYYGEHPTWSPMAVKSALMTTAAPTLTPDGSPSNDAYAQGAGQVRPDRMLSPGVVFDSGAEDWLGFLANYTELDGVEPVDPTQLNQPSIAIGALVGRETVTRRVTAVKPGRYVASISVPGVKATVTPAHLVFNRAGQTKTIRVALTPTSAPTDAAAFGSLTLRGPNTTARVPIAVTPRTVDAPEEVSGTGASGSVGYTLTSGISGTLALRPAGLAAPLVRTGSVTKGQGPVAFTLEVKPNTKALRFALASVDPKADIDLYLSQVIDGVPELVALSGSTTGVEEITLRDPAEGSYVVEVEPYAPAGPVEFVLREYQLGDGGGRGNLTVSPTDPTVEIGERVPVTVSWSGLEPDETYLGSVIYPDGTQTLVEVTS